MSRTATTNELCVRCGVNPRRPMAETCAPCRHEITNEYFRERQRKIREASYVVKESPCQCGCGLPVVYPVKYATEACKEVGRRASMERNNERRRKKRAEGEDAPKSAAKTPTDHPERFGLKPHRPAKVITLSKKESDALDAEQERLNAEASAADRAWHAQFMKDTLGLESAPGQPLATKVVRPPKEVWRELEAAYRPQSSHEREIFVPARADISY